MDEATLNEVERSACPTCGSCSGMFTANSMNCLTEALGLSLPGNGSLLATHADRRELFLEAGRRIVDVAKLYYEQDVEAVLPRNIASFKAFENAMSLDIAMGGSTNTVLHLLAAALEGEVDFTMADIDRLSRKVPCLSKVAPTAPGARRLQQQHPVLRRHHGFQPVAAVGVYRPLPRHSGCRPSPARPVRCEPHGGRGAEGNGPGCQRDH